MGSLKNIQPIWSSRSASYSLYIYILAIACIYIQIYPVEKVHQEAQSSRQQEVVGDI